MTNLTEAWHKGELPSGWYWVKNEFGNIFLSEYSEDYDCISDRAIKDFFTEVSRITEIVCKAPTYEQWVMTKNLSERAHLEMYKARGEAYKLKELLKRAKEILEDGGDYMIVQEIKQVLGDKTDE